MASPLRVINGRGGGNKACPLSIAQRTLVGLAGTFPAQYYPAAMLRAATLAVTLLLALPCAAADIMGQATVIDGDTLEIHGRRIRLFGIDAPEAPQTCIASGKTYLCGQQAALALADKIGRGVVSCEQRDTDRYGRIVAICFAGGADLGSWLVEQGWALAFRRYSTAYVTQEHAADTAGRGMWRGEFVMPWDWRKGVR